MQEDIKGVKNGQATLPSVLGSVLHLSSTQYPLYPLAFPGTCKGRSPLEQTSKV